MTSLDYLAIGIMSISVVLGVMRGIVKEILSLLTWVIAYFLAQTFYLDALPWLPAEIPGLPLKVLCAFLLVLLTGWLVMTLVSIAAAELIKQGGLTSLDRGLGVLFGLLRGLFILVVLSTLAGLTKLPQSSLWRESAVTSPLEAVVVEIKPWLPNAIVRLVRY